MSEEATRIVISDLHLGAADRFDIFDATGKTDSFIAFLEACAARPEPVELVLNGDFVDFLQITPWDADPSRSAAVIKARTIAAANARLLAALGTFLGDPKNSLRVLLGNHDIELAFDDVWEQIEKPIRTVAPAARLKRHNERVSYNPTINGVHIAIEHGNKRDYWNEIHYPELFQDAEKGTTLYRHPPGTRLVYNLMNGFKNHFLFVDLLKPEMPTVPLLLFRLRPLKASAAVPAATWNLLKAFAYGLAGAVRRGIAGPQLAAPGSAPAPTAEEAAFDRMATEFLAGMSEAEKKTAAVDIERYVEDEDLSEDAPDVATLGKRWDAFKNAMKRTVLRHLGRSAPLGDRAWFSSDHPDLQDVQWAAHEFVGKIQVVVFGHTHGALKHEPHEDAVYLNSGTWANLIEIPLEPEKFKDWLPTVADNSFTRTSFPTFVTLEPISTGIRAGLHHWNGTAAEVLWTKNINPSR